MGRCQLPFHSLLFPCLSFSSILIACYFFTPLFPWIFTCLSRFLFCHHFGNLYVIIFFFFFFSHLWSALHLSILLCPSFFSITCAVLVRILFIISSSHFRFSFLKLHPFFLIFNCIFFHFLDFFLVNFQLYISFFFLSLFRVFISCAVLIPFPLSYFFKYFSGFFPF